MPIPSLPLSHSQRLHHRLGSSRQALLATAVMRAIEVETIRLRPYITLLRGLRGLHATMDVRLPELPLRLPTAPLLRLPVLDRDLRIWDPDAVVRTPPMETLLVTLDPHGLIGALYALEASRQAVSGMAMHLARCFSLPDATAAGLHYHGTADPQQWLQCTDAIDRLVLTPADEDTVGRGAVATMALLIERHQAVKA